jgi:hypothetical protein
MESLNLYKDDKFIIHMSKHHWHGIVIQVARFGPKQVVDAGGRIVEDRAPYMVWEKKILTIKNPTDKSKIEAHSAEDFKQQVNEAIVESRQVLGRLKELENMMDGVLIDYLHQSRQYNDAPLTDKEVAEKNKQLPMA